jgi:hypothetical protein
MASFGLPPVSVTDAALHLGAGLLLLLFLWAIFTAVTNPLSSIPGPFWSRWTDLPVRLTLLFGSKAQYVHALHEKYG